MTNEEDFQATLDADPLNFFLRTVFADFLQERGDPRGPGYRVLGDRHKVPSAYKLPEGIRCAFNYDGDKDWNWWRQGEGTFHIDCLPDEWYDLLTDETPDEYIGFKAYNTRRAAEDAAALAFSLIPDKVIS